MDLRLRDLSKILKVSEKTIYRWVAQKKIPFYRINRQFRFNSEEIEQWARRIGIDKGTDLEIKNAPLDVLGIISRGGIHYRIEGNNPESVIKNCMNIIPLPNGVDRNKTTRFLLEREAMMPTTIGKGIAVPHPRHPQLCSIDDEFAAICLLETPIDFGALDRELVHTVIILVCANTMRHLRAISEIGNLCTKKNVLNSFVNKMLRNDIYKALRLEKHKIDNLRASF